MWFELLLIILTFLMLVGTQLIPTQCRYVSYRKRRAIRLALQAFSDAHEIKPNRLRCGIYKTDAKHCIVMIADASTLRPPILAFYSIRDDANRANHIGSGQCAWAIQPEDVWQNHSKKIAS